MNYYSTLPNGKIKYYWEDNKDNPDVFLADPIDGIDGVRQWLLDVIPPNESVIDIGCGPGTVYGILKGRNDYLGVDNDPASIKLAKAVFPEAKLESEDVHFLPYDDNSYDHCVLFTVIEMLPDFRRAVEEAVRVAKKQVIITTFVTLWETRDRNRHCVNPYGDYIVNINKERFLKHINSLGEVSSGTLEKGGTIQYWWWVIKK